MCHAEDTYVMKIWVSIVATISANRPVKSPLDSPSNRRVRVYSYIYLQPANWVRDTQGSQATNVKGPWLATAELRLNQDMGWVLQPPKTPCITGESMTPQSYMCLL